MDLGLIERVLTDGGLVFAKDRQALPRPRRVDGKPFAHVGRLRADPLGDGVHLWVSMDNLRGTAAVAVATAGAYLKRIGVVS